MTQEQAAKKKIEWLQYCLSIGWDKSEIPALSDLWDKFKDEFGNMRQTQPEAATPPPQGLAWVKAKEGDKFDSRSVVRFIHTKFAIQDAAGFIKRFPHRIDTLEYLVESAPAPQTDASQLREELEAIHKNVAEWKSLRSNINESFLKEYFPKKEMEYNDKVVLAIGAVREELAQKENEIERLKGLLGQALARFDDYM